MSRRSDPPTPPRGAGPAAVPSSAPAPQGAPWARLIAANLARALLMVGLGLALWASSPALLGWQPTTVMSGSMQPRIAAGDVVTARPVPRSELRPGQVLLVDDPDHAGRLRLHRLVRSNPDGRLVLRGDANPHEDSTPVDPDAVHGVGFLRVPLIAAPVMWLHGHAWTNLAGLLAVVLTLVAATRLDRGLTQPDSGAEHSAPPPTPTGGPMPQARRQTASSVSRSARPGRPGRPGRTGLIAASTAAAVALVAVMGVSPAGAGFARTSGNTGDTWAAAPYYTCSAAVLAASPYLYYKLDETSAGTATDSSGNGRNGTYRGTGTTTGSPGACVRDASTAITLNGSTGYISTPTSLTAPNTFTIETWFKTSTTAGGKLVGFGSAQTGASTAASIDRHMYLTNTGTIVFGVHPSSGFVTVTSPQSYNDGAWHLATATLSTSGLALYLDGQVVATSTAATTGQSQTGYWRIGYDRIGASWPNNPTSPFLAATLDDAAIYTTALTATKIADHYNAGR